MELKMVLASNSPRRKEIMDKLGFDVEIITSDIDENIDAEGICPELLVQELALIKGGAVAGKLKNRREKLVVSADTVVVYEGRIFGKPKNREEAVGMLKTFSGKKHSVITGVAVWNLINGKSCSGYEITDVYFKKLSDELIEAYLDTGEYSDKAGAYGIQGKAGVFVDKIVGDYYNVVGFPVNKFYELVRLCHGVDIMSVENNSLWKTECLIKSGIIKAEEEWYDGNIQTQGVC